MDSVSGEELTYRQLGEDVVQLTAALWQHGLRQGDVLCLITPNCIQYHTVILATLSCGATIGTANTKDETGEANNVIDYENVYKKS